MFALLICHSLTRYLFSLPFCWSQRRSPVSVPSSASLGSSHMSHAFCFLLLLTLPLDSVEEDSTYCTVVGSAAEEMIAKCWKYTLTNENIKWIFPDSQITCVLVCILNGTILGLCSGKKFASLTAGPFDVLLQSLPVAVSSSHICSHLLCCLLSSTARCSSWPCVSLSLWICTYTGV